MFAALLKVANGMARLTTSDWMRPCTGKRKTRARFEQVESIFSLLSFFFFGELENLESAGYRAASIVVAVVERLSNADIAAELVAPSSARTIE